MSHAHATLQVIHDPQPDDDLLVDIISIPGLPRTTPSFSSRGNSAWLQSTLAPICPNARIISFEYTANKSDDWIPCWQEILDAGDELLYSLIHLRGEQPHGRVPIIFFCRSFGGLIAKQCLNKSAARHGSPPVRGIFENTSGLIFLGTINNEHEKDFDINLCRCAAVELGIQKKRHPRMDALRASLWQKSDPLRQANEVFSNLKAKFTVLTFYEEEASVYERRSLRKYKTILVPKRLAVVSTANEKSIPLPCAHLEISGPPQQKSASFDAMMGPVKSLYLEILRRPTVSQSQDFLNGLGSGNQNENSQGSENDQLIILTHEESNDNTPKPDPLEEAFANTYVFASPPIDTVARTPCYALGPYQPNEDFVGRQKILKQLKDSLHPKRGVSTQSFLLYGLGGMGKTEASVQFVHQSMSVFRVILWLHAESKAKLTEGFVESARMLGLVEEVGRDLDKPCILLKQWLEATDEPWLLVFDNADDPNAPDYLADFWPSNDSGSILITSRTQRLFKTFARHAEQLGVLDERSAIDLLLKLSQSNEDPTSPAVDDLVTRLDHLPLGIVSVASLMRNDTISAAEFLETYTNTELVEETLMHKDISTSLRYKLTLGTVWEIEFQNLSPNAKSFIDILAFMDTDKIQEELISDAAHKVQDSALAHLTRPNVFNKTRGELVRSSLISRNEKQKQIWMHRLVREVCHVRMKSEARQNAFQSAINILNSTLPVQKRHERHLPKLWPIVRKHFAHVISLSNYYKLSRSESNDRHPRLKPDQSFARLLYNCAWYMYEQDTFDSASELVESAEKCCIDQPEGSESTLADLYHLKASLDSESNRPENAMENYKRFRDTFVEAQRKGLTEPCDIRQGTSLASMGHGLQCLDRYEEAEPFYRETLRVWKDNLPGSPVLWELGLALCLYLQGKLDEAEEMCQQIIKAREALYGPFDTVSTFTCAAMVIQGNIRVALGQHEAAYHLFVHALDLYKKTFGVEHHKTADICYKVAWHTHRRGEFDEAIFLLEQALKIYRKRSNCDNEIARCLYKMGSIYQDGGDFEKGRQVLAEAESLRQRIMGDRWTPSVDEGDYDKLIRFWSR